MTIRGISGGERSTLFVHPDGAYLSWAVGLLADPVDEFDDSGYLEVMFVVDGVDAETLLRFNPGDSIATVAFDPPIMLKANETTLGIRADGWGYGAAGLSVAYRFTRLYTPT